MSYKVTAPLVLARDQGGKVRYHYYDSVIPWLSDEHAAHLLDLELVAEVPESEVVDPEVVVSDAELAAGDPNTDPGPVVGEMPNRVAPKSDWVAYAVIAHDVSEEEADGLTKAELIERFG